MKKYVSSIVLSLSVTLVLVCGVVMSHAQNRIAQEAVDVSIIRLIAAPERYHGRRVRVHGYMRLEFEGNAVYLHEEDYKKSLHRNGIWLEMTSAQYKTNLNLNNRYVLIEGVFDAKNSGHMGMFSGEIKQINRVQSTQSKLILRESIR